MVVLFSWLVCTILQNLSVASLIQIKLLMTMYLGQRLVARCSCGDQQRSPGCEPLHNTCVWVNFRYSGVSSRETQQVHLLLRLLGQFTTLLPGLHTVWSSTKQLSRKTRLLMEAR